MTVVLGYVPFKFTLPLSRDGDYVAALIRKSGPWPDGAAIQLRFSATGIVPIVWPATLSVVTVSGVERGRAAWEVDKADVREVLEADANTVRLYIDDLQWGRGQVADVT